MALLNTPTYGAASTQPAANISIWAAIYRDESGQDLIEYALIAALIALAAVTSLKGFSNKISNLYVSIQNGITSAA